jgi:uncharacterized membrane protein
LGFEKLGFSPLATLFSIIFMIVGSFFNLPILKRRLMINVGGGVFPLFLSVYFFYLLLKKGADIRIFFFILFLVTLLCKKISFVDFKRGVVIPALFPAILSSTLSFIFLPKFAPLCSFSCGSLGVLIGADILNLPKILKQKRNLVSIGGAGVFDAVFLVGIFSLIFF